MITEIGTVFVHQSIQVGTLTAHPGLLPGSNKCTDANILGATPCRHTLKRIRTNSEFSAILKVMKSYIPASLDIPDATKRS